MRTLRHFACYLWLTLLFGLATVSAGFAQTAPAKPSAIYARENLTVTIPYRAERQGSGRLLTEVVDPEDHVLARTDKTVEAVEGGGSWQQTLVAEKPLAIADLVWLRLRYRFDSTEKGLPTVQGIESIGQILRRPVIHIVGQSEYLAGSEAAVRVILSDASGNDAEPVALAGSVRIELVIPNEPARPLFTGRVNRRGTIDAQFRFPAELTGKFDLRFVADSPIGSSEFVQPITLQDKASILLTTEKPLYQPGQTIHVRALVLNRADHKAVADKPLTFAVEDARGNKVFKKATATDRFGVASAEFSLADEVNLGTYHLRALMGDAETPSNTAEVALNVERYVLPKFKVSVDFTVAGNKPKRDYRPGDHVTGTVHANYFFGKPVDHAEITVKASAMDVAVFSAASADGKTDAEGVYRFDLKLPSYFAGGPLSQGAARALVEATVKDSAAHSETRGEPITVSESSLLITAVPEGGTLVPHLENDVFVLTSYPDGTPASTSLVVHLPDGSAQKVATDAGGVAVVRLNPGKGMDSLTIDADDRHGNVASSHVPLQMREGSDQVLLRTSRAVLKDGDRLQLSVLSTRSTGTAYVDIVKNGQTVLTRDLDLHNGQAELSLTVTPEMAGTLDIDAYLFGRDAQPVADHRLVFVQPANELKIEATADAAEYKPGDDARVHFHVTNSRGDGVSAALGLQVVDEAVFALAEKEPGFAKVFFYLEQEVMKPRFEIHSVSMEGLVGTAPLAEQDLEARALFSATEMASPAQIDREVGRTLPQEKFAEYQQRYGAAFDDQVREIAEHLDATLHKTPAPEKDFADAFEKDAGHPLDAWGNPLHIERTAYRPYWDQSKGTYYLVKSAGPDGQLDTADDIQQYLHVSSSGSVSGEKQSGRGSVAVQIDHDRGPFNGLAEIVGTVNDSSGAIIPGTLVRLRQRATNSTRVARASSTGQFLLSGLPTGAYELEFSAAGFERVERRLVLAARDRAVVATVLGVGRATETVNVTAKDLAVGVEFDPAQVNFGGAVGSFSMSGSPMQAAAAQGRGRMAMMGSGMAAGSAGGTGRPNSQVITVNAIADGKKLPIVARDVAAASENSVAHVRSYFPEALYINPEIVTDGRGDATISIPMADSITTWRMAMLASTVNGGLGTATSSLKVFQDFFADLDLPVTLTQGDRVTIPVGIYNYSGKAGRVTLKLEPEAWYALGDDAATKTLSVEAGRVGGSQFTLSAQKIGKFKLTLRAHMDATGGQASREDIVVREIEVIPNGREQNAVFNGRLDGSGQNSVEHDLTLPGNATPEATTLFVRLYPGPLSQVIEGMDSILRMPGGCFEQTSSSTYPNVLALDYMKRTNKLTPEVHAKAEGYIANGYQRLLTFEVPGGGFSWFGSAPANKILTAYGVMEFNDMAKVSDVDPRLIARTRDWLAAQQQEDGSWKPDASFINEGATNRYNSDVLRITAYVAWALADTGYRGAAVEKAQKFIEGHLNASAKPDAYTLAVIANFAGDDDPTLEANRDFTRRAMQALLDAKTEKGDQVWWDATDTAVYSTGKSAAIETTGLAAQALLKWGEANDTVRKALGFIASSKQAEGNWGTTQATIMALRALLMASEHSTSDVRGTVKVLLDGEVAQSLELTPENNDLLHQFVFKGAELDGIDRSHGAKVELKFEGSGGLAYQVVGRYFTPWETTVAKDALSIDVAYDRSSLTQNDIATATATIHNNLQGTANMVMVDLGIPPGFELLSEDLQTFEDKSSEAATGRLEKFSLTATQAILYFNALAPGQTVKLSVRLRAKYPIHARTFQSRVYEYYDPQVSATAQPQVLEVKAR
jgi:hypothetical protein